MKNPIPDGMLGDAAWFTRQVDAHHALLRDLPEKDRRRVAVRYTLCLDTMPILKPASRHWLCGTCLHVVPSSVKACPDCGRKR